MKRGGGPNELDPPPKVSKTRESVDEDECVGDWQVCYASVQSSIDWLLYNSCFYE